MSIEKIDLELCTGCGVCVNNCPMDVLRLDALVADSQEYPPCQIACPAGVNIRLYFSLLKQDRIEEAIGVLRESLPIPAITGRVCPHYCETMCARGDVDEAVNINSLERFVADYWLHEEAQPVRKLYAAKVAIVGSGPAGLSAAYDLVKMGYPVTVFEAMPMLGGMLRAGIPEYRLPEDILDTQLNYIKDLGVDFQTNTAIGKEKTLEDLKSEGYQAVFFAVGAQLSSRLGIDGADLDGVLWGLDFLKAVNLKRGVEVKDKVMVIGGGNVAIDVAMVALRLGAQDVQVVCLESSEEMPAFASEIKEAVDEGIKINTCWGPKRIIGNDGRVKGIEIVRCVSAFDAEGNFHPCYDEHVTKTIETNMVIIAIGQVSDVSLMPEKMCITTKKTIQVDEITLETSIQGIFAGGDAVSGPASVVEAIAGGRKAAISIDRYLRGKDLKLGRGKKLGQVKRLPNMGMEKKNRLETPVISVDERKNNFRELKTAFCVDEARQEVQRCLTCGSRPVITYVEDCMLCDACELECPSKAIYVSPVKNGALMIGWG